MTPLLLRYDKERDRRNAAQCVTEGSVRLIDRFNYKKRVRIYARRITTMALSKTAPRCQTNDTAVVALMQRTRPTQRRTVRHAWYLLICQQFYV